MPFVPEELIVDERRRRVYILFPLDGYLGFLDAATLDYRCHMSIEGHPIHAALMCRGRSMLVASRDTGMVSLIDLEQFEIKQTVRVGSAIRRIIAISDSMAVTVNQGSDDVSIVSTDGKDLEFTAIRTGRQPISAAVIEGSRLLVVHKEDTTACLVDANRRAIITKVTLNREPRSAIIDPLTMEAYVVCPRANLLAILNRDGQPTGTVSVGDAPIDAGFTARTRIPYVINGRSDSVSLIDRTTKSVRASAKTPGTPLTGVALPNSDILFVCSFGTGSISAVDCRSGHVVGSFQLGRKPFGTACSAKLNRVYISHEEDCKIGIIEVTHS